MMRTFASIQLSDTDKKALIILLVVLVIALLLIGLLGAAVRATMRFQSKRADRMMHDVTVTHVIDTPQKFRRFGNKKNNRALFRDSLKPFLVALAGLAIWIIYNIATKEWTRNIFDDWNALFIHLKLNPADYPADDPLVVRVFGLWVLARWPMTDPAYPRFDVAAIPIYIEVALFLTALVWYLIVCQAYVARFIMIQRRANSVFEQSLEGYKASEEIKVAMDKPLPPSD